MQELQTIEPSNSLSYDELEAYLATGFNAGVKMDVSKYTEKKGGFTYISWAHSVKELFLTYPLACFSWEDFGEKNYMETPAGFFVRVLLQLHPSGPIHMFDHPVLDNRNKTIKEPNAFDINTSRMRALSKIISMVTGIGLHLYAGEDLPDNFVGGIEADDKDVEHLNDLLNGKVGERMLNGHTLKEVYTKRLDDASWSRKMVKDMTATLEKMK